LEFSQFCPISKKTPTKNRNNCGKNWRV
jgi:hypothetical protein